MRYNYKDFEQKFSKQDILELFEKFDNKKDLCIYLKIKGWANGDRLLKKLADKIGEPLTKFYPTKKNQREIYESNPTKCLQCGKLLSYEHRHDKFCSRSCSATYNNIKRGRKKKYCVCCGNEITGDHNTYKKFCCKECEKQYKYEIPKMDKLNRWLNGENFIVGHSNVPRFIRRYLMTLYNCKCQLCGWGETNIYSNTVPLEIHHIDGDCTNNKFENLQLLCPNCHSYTNTFCYKSKDTQVQENDFVEALLISSNIRAALIKLGLTPSGGNYSRAYTLIEKYNISHLKKEHPNTKVSE